MAEQQQEGSVDVAAAREFVTSFVPDPKILEGMDDTAVVAYHGSLTSKLDEHKSKAIESYDWRKAIAGDDADRMKTLERFPSQRAMYDSYAELRTKLSKGEPKAVQQFPEKGTDEQKAEWRQQNGVPPDGKYEIKPPSGVQMTEADSPLIEGFTKYAYEKNLPAGAVNDVAAWWLSQRAERQATAASEKEQLKTATAAELGKEYGADYTPIQNKIKGLLDASIPSGEDGDKLKTALGDALATNPMFNRMFAKLALELNPTGSIAPGDRGATESNLVDELKKIDETMRTDRAKYDRDSGMQNRYTQLLGHYQKVAGKDWAPGS